MLYRLTHLIAAAIGVSLLCCMVPPEDEDPDEVVILDDMGNPVDTGDTSSADADPDALPVSECDNFNACPGDLTCVLESIDGVQVGRCIDIPAVGEPCDGSTRCGSGAICIEGDNEAVCMKRCEGSGRLCDSGALCTPIDVGGFACYTGGTAQRGEECGSNATCDVGLRCISSNLQTATCRLLCDRDNPVTCGPRESCTRSIGELGECYQALGDACTQFDCKDVGDISLRCAPAMLPVDEARVPNGYCTVPDCTSDSDCPEQGVCREAANFDRTMCLATCTQDSDCRVEDGYTCLTAASCQNAADPQTCASLVGDATGVCLGSSS